MVSAHSGPSVAESYWANPGESRVVFDNTLSSDPGCSFLRTGDLGYIDEQGFLYVVGRSKDVMIVRGRTRRLDQPEALGFRRYVGGNGRRLRAGCPDLRHGAAQRPLERVIALLQGARHADDLGALARQQLGDRLTDAAARAGDDGHPPRHLRHGHRGLEARSTIVHAPQKVMVNVNHCVARLHHVSSALYRAEANDPAIA